MSNNDNNDNYESKYIEFMYATQYNRLLNPMYIFLTKAGFFSTIFYMYLRSEGNTGIMLFLFYFLFLYWTYKTNFSYKYYEKEHVWLIRLLVNFLNKKIKRTFRSHALLESAREEFKEAESRNT